MAKKKVISRKNRTSYRNLRCGCLDDLPKDFETEEEARNRMLQICPLLSNPGFTELYPDAIRVAEILHATAEIHTRAFGGFDLFDKLKVEDVNGFLSKLEQKYAAAVGLYMHIRGDLSVVYDIDSKKASGHPHDPGFYVRPVNRFHRSQRRGFKDYHTEEER